MERGQLPKNLRFAGECVAAFVFYGDEFIINKRQGALGAQSWGPPGGKLDPGETPEEGVAREVKEETGLIIGTIACIGSTIDEFIDKGIWYRTTWFTAISVDNKASMLEPDRCVEQRWCTLDSLPENLFFPTQNILADEIAFEQIQQTATIGKS